MLTTLSSAQRHYCRHLIKLAVGNYGAPTSHQYDKPAAPKPPAPPKPLAPPKPMAPLSASSTTASQPGPISQAGSAVWNYGANPLLRTGMNTLEGISTVGRGAANTLGGGLGNMVSGVGYGIGAATDAAGMTNNAKGWVADNMWRHTNNAVHAGLKDMAGGAADVATGGMYDYDGTFAAPGQHGGTAVEQARAGIRDELGRGSALDTTFNLTNNVSDFAADSLAFAGAGRGLNVGAQALKASPMAAPVLNTMAKTPVIGKPMAAAGNWLAGKAPAANMFAPQAGQPHRFLGGQTAQQYYGNMARSGVVAAAMQGTDDVVRATDAVTNINNPLDRPTAKKISEAADVATQRLTAAQNDAEREVAIKDLAKSMEPALSGEDRAAATAIANGDFESPQAQKFMAEQMGPAGEQFRAEWAQQQIQQQPEKANDPGFFGQIQGMASQAWEGMGPMGQLAFTFGAPMALIGLLGGGGLMSLLGGLGIGVAGLGAAGMGMFGDQARAGVGRMLGDAANFFGAIPDEARTTDAFYDAAGAATESRIADAMRSAKPGEGAAVGQQMLDAERAKFEPLRDLYARSPDAAHTYLMGLRGAGAPQTAEEAEALYQKLLARYNETGAENYLRDRAMAAARAQYQKEHPYLSSFTPESWVDAQAAKQLGFKQSSALNAMDQKELHDLQEQKAQGVPYRTDDARRAHQLQLRQQAQRPTPSCGPKPVVKRTVIMLCMKSARCWAGYEPVPGKKPYSEDSCRPISKSKSKKKKGPPAKTK